MSASIPSFKDRPFRERVELRTTFHKVAEAFEACSKLKEADRLMLLREISKRLNQLMRQTVAESPSPAAAGFAIRCVELAAVTPNDKIRNALLTIAQINEAETADDDRA